jgi:hypothetical protein
MAAKKPTEQADAADTTATGIATNAGAAADQPQERQPLPVPDGGWPADEYTGKPGSYVRDPFTGIRSPAADAAE